MLVCDNLNTHPPASVSDAFPPAAATRLTDKLEVHDLPKHGNWLNIAELNLSVRSRQCRDRRVRADATLHADVKAWENRHNQASAKVAWRFTTKDARIKLKRLYPSIQE